MQQPRKALANGFDGNGEGPFDPTLKFFENMLATPTGPNRIRRVLHTEPHTYIMRTPSVCFQSEDGQYSVHCLMFSHQKELAELLGGWLQAEVDDIEKCFSDADKGDVLLDKFLLFQQAFLDTTGKCGFSDWRESITVCAPIIPLSRGASPKLS